LKTTDEFIVQKEYRLQMLGLLCSFVGLQGPHLYQILETPLLQSLIRCLENDTSTVIISLALTSLIMFMPHIPDAIGQRLPRLFLVYARILCWDRIEATTFDGSDSKHDADDENSTKNVWQKVDSSYETASSTPPDVSHLFTFLYGLYPINFMSFLREPYKYLEKSKSQDMDDLDLDEDLIRHRTEPFRQRHLVHSNFMSLTADSELSQKSRWMKSEPADVVAQCIDLVPGIATFNTLVDVQPPTNSSIAPEALIPTEDIPLESLLGPPSPRIATGAASTPAEKAQLETDSVHEQQRNMPSSLVMSNLATRFSSSSFALPGSAVDSPILSPLNGTASTLPGTEEERKLDMIHLHGTLRSSKMNDSVSSLPMTGSVGQGSATTSPRLEAYAHHLSLNHHPMSPAMKPSVSETQGSVAFLQREVMLLKNDLNFERYLKEQHLSHIGHLQRKHIKDSTLEAETQYLLNTNKTLKRKIEEAAKLYQKLKEESQKNRIDSKKWESELNNRIKKLREEKKVWSDEEQSVKEELANTRSEANQLKRLVVESEAKELLARQRMQALESNLADVEKLRAQVEQLSSKLHEHDNQASALELQKQGQHDVAAEVERMKMRLQAREHEWEDVKRYGFFPRQKLQ